MTKKDASISTTSTTPSKTMLSLKEVVEMSGLSPVYVRRAILTGKLASTKVPVGDTAVLRHEIALADYEAWRAGTGVRGRRSDGRGKYTLYGTPEEVAAIEAMIAQASANVSIAKAKTYGKAKKAADVEALPSELSI
jgi:hypothetical protein